MSENQNQFEEETNHDVPFVSPVFKMQGKKMKEQARNRNRNLALVQALIIIAIVLMFSSLACLIVFIIGANCLATTNFALCSGSVSTATTMVICGVVFLVVPWIIWGISLCFFKDC